MKTAFERTLTRCRASGTLSTFLHFPLLIGNIVERILGEGGGIPRLSILYIYPIYTRKRCYFLVKTQQLRFCHLNKKKIESDRNKSIFSSEQMQSFTDCVVADIFVNKTNSFLGEPRYKNKRLLTISRRKAKIMIATACRPIISQINSGKPFCSRRREPVARNYCRRLGPP